MNFSYFADKLYQEHHAKMTRHAENERLAKIARTASHATQNNHLHLPRRKWLIWTLVACARRWIAGFDETPLQLTKGGKS